MQQEQSNRHLQEVCTALTRYIEDGASVSLHSQQQGSELAITFTLADADPYHPTLSTLLGKLSGALADNGRAKAQPASSSVARTTSTVGSNGRR